MNGTQDSATTETYEDEGALDPRAAAQLLAQTRRQAQRELDFRSPWLSLFASAVTLAAFGAVWLSVRGQHPYKGPTAVSLVVLYAVVLMRIGSVVYAHRRARAGVSGRSVSQRRAEGAGLVVALVAVYVLMGALAHAGASDSVVYGVYVVTATLIVLGAFWAGRSAVREDWLGLGIVDRVHARRRGQRVRRTPRGVAERRCGLLRRAPWIQRHASLAAPRAPNRRMSADTLDTLIHVPARLQIVATLAALPEGDALSFTRLQEMIGLTPGNLITHLRKLEDADYLISEKTGNGPASRTSVALTHRGRAALERLHRDAARHAQRTARAFLSRAGRRPAGRGGKRGLRPRCR